MGDASLSYSFANSEGIHMEESDPFFFFITPKMKSKQLHSHQKCWRGCGSLNVDHYYILSEDVIVSENNYSRKYLCREPQQILGYGVPKTCSVLFTCVNSQKRLLTLMVHSDQSSPSI